MSKEMKYVIVDDSCPILFSLGQRHGDFGRMRPSSAGKCRIYFENDKFKVDCYGESIDLKLKPDEHDSRMIELMLNYF